MNSLLRVRSVSIRSGGGIGGAMTEKQKQSFNPRRDDPCSSPSPDAGECSNEDSGHNTKASGDAVAAALASAGPPGCDNEGETDVVVVAYDLRAQLKRERRDRQRQVEEMQRQKDQVELELSLVNLELNKPERVQDYATLLVQETAGSDGAENDGTAADTAEMAMVPRLQAQLCQNMHQTRILEDRLSIVKQSSDAIIASLNEELAELVDEKSQMEMTFLNELTKLNHELSRVTETYERRLKDQRLEYERQLEERSVEHSTTKLEEQRRRSRTLSPPAEAFEGANKANGLVGADPEDDDDGEANMMPSATHDCYYHDEEPASPVPDLSASVSSSSSFGDDDEDELSISAEREWAVDSTTSDASIVADAPPETLDQYEAALTLLERELIDATTKADDLTVRNQTLAATNDELRREITSLGRTVQHLQEENVSLELQAKTMVEEIRSSSCSALCTKQAAEAEAAREHDDLLTLQNKRLIETNEILSNDKASLERQVEWLTAAAAETQEHDESEVDAIKAVTKEEHESTTLVDLTQDLEAARKECDAARTANANLSAQNQRLNETIDDLTREKAALEERMEGLETERLDHENRVKAVSEESETKQQEYESNVAALHEELDAVRLNCSDLTQEKTKLEERMEGLETERLEHENRANAVAEESENKQKEYESNVAALHKELDAVRLECNRIGIDKTTLTQSLEQVRDELTQRQSQHSLQVESLSSDLAWHKKAMDSMNEDMKKTQFAHDLALLRWKQVAHACEALSLEKQYANGRIRTLTSKLAVAEKSMSSRTNATRAKDESSFFDKGIRLKQPGSVFSA